MNTAGQQYRLQRRMRAEDAWQTITASDDRGLMEKLFDKCAKQVTHGGLRLFDVPTEATLMSMKKPDFPEGGRDGR